jgi:hypothetical protein
VKSTCLTITKKLVLEPELEVSCGAAAFPNNLHKISGDCVVESGDNDDIHPGPACIVGEGIARLDVVIKGISRQGQQHVVTPPGVVVKRGIQNDVHEGTHSAPQPPGCGGWGLRCRVVAGFVVEEDADPGTSFLTAAACY